MPRYSALGANPWLDLYADVSLFRDAAVFALSLSLSHVALNEVMTPDPERVFCLPSSGLHAVLYTLVCFFSTIGIVSRANIPWGESKRADPEKGAFVDPSPSCTLHYTLECVWDAFGVLAGAWFQVTAKPSQWFISVPLSGCSVHDSPLHYISFFLGELLSFGSGIRVVLFVLAATHIYESRSSLRLWALVAGALLSLALTSVFYAIDPPLTTAIEGYRNSSKNT